MIISTKPMSMYLDEREVHGNISQHLFRSEHIEAKFSGVPKPLVFILCCCVFLRCVERQWLAKPL